MKVIKLTRSNLDKVADALEEGKIVCFPTDTIYGLLVKANDSSAIERLYSIRRPSNRPFLMLIDGTYWLKDLGVIYRPIHERLMNMFNATFIFYKKNTFPLYLTRGRKSLAVRIPPFDSYVYELLEYLKAPVVAPSANPEGQKPATTIKEAIEYFGDKVDLYVDGGVRKGKPSTIVRALYPKGLRLVREGNIPFKKILQAYRGLRTTFSALPEDAPLEFSSLDLFDLGPPFPPLR